MSVVFDRARQLFDNDSTLAIAYPWDSWRAPSYFSFMDKDVADRLEPLSHAAQFAFLLANSEWVCARHFREPRVADVLHYIDAAWANALTGAKVEFREFPEEEWQGPVLGPLCYAQLIVAAEQLDGRHDRLNVARACWARNLVLYVLGEAEREVFERWTVASLTVLEKNHPYTAPRWSSIFDTEFSNMDRCPPDAFAQPNLYDRAEMGSYITQQMMRAGGSPYLASTIKDS